MKRILLLLSLVSLASCNVDDQADFFMSQNRSEELQGSWKITTNIYQEMPIYHVFTGDRYHYISYSNTSEKFYADTKKYWYNNAISIFTIGNSSVLKKDTPSEIRYKLNATKDTLSIYEGSNKWTNYAKFNGELPVK